LAVSDQPETVRRGAVTRRPMAVADFTTELRAVMAAGRGAAR